MDPGEDTPAKSNDVQQYHWRAELLDKDREIQQLKIKLLAIEELSGNMDKALQRSKEKCVGWRGVRPHPRNWSALGTGRSKLDSLREIQSLTSHICAPNPIC